MSEFNSEYDRLADEYYADRHVTSRNFDAATKRALIDKNVTLVSSGLILEAGCGKGRVHEFLGVRSERVVQLDRSLPMLELSPREDALLRIHHTAESLPFPRFTFSAVVGFLCDPFFTLSFVNESHRVLKPGGEFIVTLPAHEWGQPLRSALKLDLFTTRFVTNDGKVVRAPSFIYSENRLEEMFRTVGFENIRISHHSLPENTPHVSKDIEKSAELLQKPVTAISIITLIQATK